MTFLGDYPVVFLCLLLHLLSWMGWGRGLASAFRFQKPLHPGEYGFLGLFLATFVGLALNFFIPLDLSFTSFWVLSGSSLFFAFRLDREFSSSSSRILIVGLILFIVTLSVVHQRPAGDTGLYHWQGVKWVAQEAWPLGLANLHGRLGYSSLWPLTAGMHRIWGLQVQLPYSVTGGIYALFWVYGLFLFSRSPVSMTRSRLFFILMLICSAILLRRVGNISSPTTDLPAFLLGVMVVFRVLEGFEAKEGSKAYWVLTFMLMSLAVTVKLSLLPLLLLFPIGMLVSKASRGALLGYLTSSLLFTLFFLRNLMTSGCLAFPSGKACLLERDWTASLSYILKEETIVKNFARAPHLQGKFSPPGWSWLPPWVDRMIIHELIWLAGVFLLLGFMSWFLGRKKLEKTSPQPWLLVWGALFSGVLFWFFMAPAPRFGAVFILGFGALPFAFFLGELWRNFGHSWEKKLPLLLVLFVLPLSLSSYLPKQYQFYYPEDAMDIRQEYPRFPIVRKTEKKKWGSEFLYTPDVDQRCWDVDLPCAPQENATASLKISRRIFLGRERYVFSRKYYIER